MQHPSINIFWFRRDLRLEDNKGLFEALKSQLPVLLIFIFDTDILTKLPKNDARLTFIHATLEQINKTLQNKYSSRIAMYHATPIAVFKTLAKTFNINTVYTNSDYEPYARTRDAKIKTFLKTLQIQFKTFKDHVIFEKSEVVKSDKSPYLVYTPYMRKWKTVFKNAHLESFKSEKHLKNLLKASNLPLTTLKSLGFERSTQKIATLNLDSAVIQHYEATRNFPAMDSTSRLGPHLRFGTVSIRDIVKKALTNANETFWNELIWREFFIQILWHFPQTKDNAFKSKYDAIAWRNNTHEFKAWCDGKTGYPLVDAGMRQLNKTGFMHNRIRMLTGSFLCKHLLIDWRWGEAYFAGKLHDYEMASNVGNWQWVAGTGVDAAPYFRIFNPTTQIKKFDNSLEYIKKWVPDFQELTYPKPIVEHQFARARCLEAYKLVLN